jgi:diguanylate cyclase (GGDEF)-like protein
MKVVEDITNQQTNKLKNQPEILLRIYTDLLKRTKPGLFTYPLVWLAIVFSSDLDKSHPSLVWVMTALFTLTSIIRYWHMTQVSDGLQHHAKLWRTSLYFIITPHCFGWGLMFGYSLLIDNPQFAFLMAFSSAGLIAGGTASFANQRKLALTFLLCFTLPSTYVALVITQQWAVGFMVIIYVLYLLKQIQQQSSEYWRSLNNEEILAKQSRTDALTQLDNRRFFDEKLNELCHLSTRNHAMIAVLVIDCDHFKNINDTFGHDFGDKCLQHLANVFRQSLPRATETCARYGGEEFCIILPATDSEGAMIVAERIRKNVETSPILLDEKEITMTVSIGVVSRQMEQFEHDLPNLLFKHADQALYRAKQNGRNTCVVAEEWSPHVSASPIAKG